MIYCNQEVFAKLKKGRLEGFFINHPRYRLNHFEIKDHFQQNNSQNPKSLNLALKSFCYIFFFTFFFASCFCWMALQLYAAAYKL